MTLEVVEHVDLSIKFLGVGPEKTGVGVQKAPACCPNGQRTIGRDSRYLKMSLLLVLHLIVRI